MLGHGLGRVKIDVTHVDLDCVSNKIPLSGYALPIYPQIGVLVYSEDLRPDFDTRQTYMGVICGNFTTLILPISIDEKVNESVFAHVRNWKNVT